MSQIYDSDRIAELFRTAEKKKISKDELFEDFSSWMKNLNKLSQMEEITNKDKVTANDYRKALGMKRPKKSKR